jgi:hypothetical protein
MNDDGMNKIQQLLREWCGEVDVVEAEILNPQSTEDAVVLALYMAVLKRAITEVEEAVSTNTYRPKRYKITFHSERYRRISRRWKRTLGTRS